MDIES
jgi:fatty acyl-CoA reductase